MLAISALGTSWNVYQKQTTAAKKGLFVYLRNERKLKADESLLQGESDRW